MTDSSLHTFHIPVMGLGFTIDTPVKIARYGISSVISIIEDNLIEEMRKFYCDQNNEEYVPISRNDFDFRAKRITSYLNLLNRIINKQVSDLKKLPFEEGNDLTKYFTMLPDTSFVKKQYQLMLASEGQTRKLLEDQLKSKIETGSIDVNIMTKVDRTIFAEDGTPLPPEFSDALSALRGFAESDLDASVVFSAGLNPRLYSYIESFNDFFPGANGLLKKKVILKVSDYRSALIQGKFLAKKGIWISEFRIESGLNCGGHAFATEGMLLGPIMEEFKLKRAELTKELLDSCNAALDAKGLPPLPASSNPKVTIQGGIGTANEHQFLLDYYQANSAGWGSPFLLVPEVTNVDDATLQQMASAKQEDYYLSYASPLGIPFNNFRPSSSEEQRKNRIDKGRPGSPCLEKFLSTNTEFTDKPICTASRQYQRLKLIQIKEKGLPEEAYKAEADKITEKDCLCEGLGTSVLLKNDIINPKRMKAVAICPGPNLAYFSTIMSLEEMVNHIYGRADLLNSLKRPNMFVNELNMYVDYLKKEIKKNIESYNVKQEKYVSNFKNNLLEGIEYYKNLADKMLRESDAYRNNMIKELKAIEQYLINLSMGEYLSVTQQ